MPFCGNAGINGNQTDPAYAGGFCIRFLPLMKYGFTSRSYADIKNFRFLIQL